MKKRERRLCSARKGQKSVFALVVMMVCPSVTALPQLDDLGRDQVSVRELMLLDTEMALQRARSSSGERRVETQGVNRLSRTMSAEPQLTAIYGVGRQLMAEVVSDHIVYLYRQGQALPVGVAPGDEVYMLSEISASCVELARSEVLHRLCLRPLRWEHK